MIYPNYRELTAFDSLGIFCWFQDKFKKLVKWSVGHATPAGNRGKAEIPPRGKRVSVAQWNELVLTT
jgi:hypothetical protein